MRVQLLARHAQNSFRMNDQRLTKGVMEMRSSEEQELPWDTVEALNRVSFSEFKGHDEWRMSPSVGPILGSDTDEG